MRTLALTAPVLAFVLSLAAGVRTQAEIASPPGPAIASLKTAYPIARTKARLQRLSRKEAKRFEKLLATAENDHERYCLIKALASGHALPEIEDFARRIHGKSTAWMQDTLQLTCNTRGLGVKQQWSMSCAPAVVQALHGQLDPIYAYQIHAESPNCCTADDRDPLKLNPRLALEQKKLLETPTPQGSRGIAVSRNQQGGKGRSITDLLAKLADKTGLTYRSIGISKTYSIARALHDIETAVKKDIPVPLHVTGAKHMHFVLATGVHTRGGQKLYAIHDPWNGRIVERTAQQFQQNALKLSGNNALDAVLEPAINAFER